MQTLSGINSIDQYTPVYEPHALSHSTRIWLKRKSCAINAKLARKTLQPVTNGKLTSNFGFSDIDFASS